MEQAPTPTADAPPAPLIPALTTNKLARFAAIILLYFMQGLPVGLITVAIPAWLAANGATPIVVGAFVGTTMLPWSLKLFGGLVMDRFTFRPMGRRRSWILIAQFGMVLSLIALALVAPGASEVGALTAILFAMNLCAVVNDVATDGMTVDLVPHEERTTINGMMFASQTLGIAATGFVAGQLLAANNVALLGVVLSGFAGCVSFFVSVFRERPGERMTPWSRGVASAECEERQHDAWWPILKGVFKAVATPLTLLFLIGLAFTQTTHTFIDAVAPTLAVQQLGWDSDQYASFVSVLGTIAAAAGATLVPLAVKAFGLRTVLYSLITILIAVAVFAGATYDSWQDARLFTATFSIQYVLAVCVLIGGVVWAMRICDPAVGASLFALFMAVPNFSRSFQSGWSGWVIEAVGYSGAYYVMAFLMVAGLAFYHFARVGDDRIAFAEEGEDDVEVQPIRD